jgi:hypothetical protein
VAQASGIEYYEVSAKSGVGVEESFLNLTHQMLKKKLKYVQTLVIFLTNWNRDTSSEATQEISLDDDNSKKKKKQPKKEKIDLNKKEEKKKGKCSCK